MLYSLLPCLGYLAVYIGIVDYTLREGSLSFLQILLPPSDENHFPFLQARHVTRATQRALSIDINPPRFVTNHYRYCASACCSPFLEGIVPTPFFLSSLYSLALHTMYFTYVLYLHTYSFRIETSFTYIIVVSLDRTIVDGTMLLRRQTKIKFFN